MADRDDQLDEAEPEPEPSMNDLLRGRLTGRRLTVRPGDDASRRMNEFLRGRRLADPTPPDDAA